MKKTVMLLMSLLFVGIGGMSAQSRTVQGTVVAEDDGLPVIGASVLVVGTSLGGITDFDGQFAILNVPAESKEIQVSYMGMKTQVVAIRPNMTIVLATDAALLEEVVVVAYGQQSRAAITGSVASVGADKIEARPVTNAAGALEGAAAGVQVNNTYGEPGSEATIRIRGFGSVNGTNDPLIVVDGVPFAGAMSDINSADIESMSILKDAASSALYGNKAANGVVLISTKRGKSQGLDVRVNVQQGVYNRGIPEYDRLNPTQWMETVWQGYRRYYMVDKKMTDMAAAGASATATLIDNIVKSNIFNAPKTALFNADGKMRSSDGKPITVLPGYTDLDWNKPLERRGYRQEYTASVNTAADKYDVYASVSYLDEKGYIISSDYNRLSTRMRVNFMPRTWLKAGVNMSAAIQTSNYADNATGVAFINPFYTARRMAPVYPYYKHNADGTIVKDAAGQPEYNIGTTYLNDRHIIYELEHDVNRTDRTALNAHTYATANFLNDFSFTIKGSLNTINATRKNYDNPVVGDGAGNNGRLVKYYRQYYVYNTSQELTWNHDFGWHHIDVLAAHEAYSYKYYRDSSAKADQKLMGGNTDLSNFASLTDIDGYTQSYNTEGYLARARYSYDDRYYFDASFRRDGSSRFFHPWGNFWSMGASWAISKEAFMSRFDWVNELKLRASYGEVGNDAGVDYYAYKALYESDTNAGLGAYYKVQNANGLLKWETSSTLDVALEGRLFDRLHFSLDLFDKRSDNLLFMVYNPLSAGATDLWGTTNEDATGMSTVYQNIGTLSNLGLEIELSADLVRNDNWIWNVGANATFLRNEIKKLPGGEDIIVGVRKYSEGHSIYEFWTYQYAGIDQMTGRSLYVANPEKVTDANLAAGRVLEIGGKYYVNDAANYGIREWSGSAIPAVYGSLSTSLSYRNLTFSLLGTYSLGGKIYDSVYADLMTMSSASPGALHTDMLRAWSGVPEGMTETSPNRIDPNGVSRADLSSQATLSTAASTRWLRDASYFVLKNARVDYTFPKHLLKAVGIGGLNVFGTVENAFTLTALKGMNPQYDFNGGADNTFVTARVFSLGLNLKF